MTPDTVKKIFIGVLIFLPLQYACVGVAGYYHSEPWPAFVFPGFKNVYVYDSGFEIDRTRFEVFHKSGQDSVMIEPQEIFPGIPLSQVPGFMRTHFHTPGLNELSEQGKRWLKVHAREAAGFEPARMDVVRLNTFYIIGAEGAAKDSVSEVSRTSIVFEER